MSSRKNSRNIRQILITFWLFLRNDCREAVSLHEKNLMTASSNFGCRLKFPYSKQGALHIEMVFATISGVAFATAILSPSAKKIIKFLLRSKCLPQIRIHLQSAEKILHSKYILERQPPDLPAQRIDGQQKRGAGSKKARKSGGELTPPNFKELCLLRRQPL